MNCIHSKRKSLILMITLASLLGASPSVSAAKSLTVSDIYVDDIDTNDLERVAKKALDRREKSSDATPEFKTLFEKKENHAYLLATSRENVIFDRIRELGADQFTSLCDPEEKSTLSTCLEEIYHEISDRHSLTTTGLAIGSTLSVLYGTELKNKIKKSDLDEDLKQKRMDHLDLEIVRSQLVILKILVNQKPKMIHVTRPDTLKVETALREKIKLQLTKFIREKIESNPVISKSSVNKELKELIKDRS
jgi:hypothetical protein